MAKNQAIIDQMKAGNEKYVSASTPSGDISLEKRVDTKVNGQHPYAIVITCSDSRVVPEHIFSAGIGEIFTIRVAGNVIDRSQLASVEYAAAHLGSRVILVLGHTNCGAVGATLEGGAEGHVKMLTDEIKIAIGNETDPVKACKLNVQMGVERIRKGLEGNHEVPEDQTDILGAVYDIETGKVEWLS